MEVRLRMSIMERLGSCFPVLASPEWILRMTCSISKRSLVPSMSWPVASVSWASPILLAFDLTLSKTLFREWFLLSLPSLGEFSLHLIEGTRAVGLDHVVWSIEVFFGEFREGVQLAVVA